MATSVTVLASPLLPVVAYERLADAFAAAGAKVSVADPTLTDGESADGLIERWAQRIDPAAILVAHSNAGLLAPRVRLLTDPGQRIVFMDAALLPEAGDAPLAPQRFRDMLTRLADEGGVLPPWTRWWPRKDFSTVIPNKLFDAIDQTCPRLPVAYFDHRIDAPAGWATGANAYLAFGKTYSDELNSAHDHCWPTQKNRGWPSPLPPPARDRGRSRAAPRGPDELTHDCVGGPEHVPAE